MKNKDTFPKILLIAIAFTCSPIQIAECLYDTSYEPYNEAQKRNRQKSKKRTRYVPEIISIFNDYTSMYRIKSRSTFIDGIWHFINIVLWTIPIWIITVIIILRQRSPPKDKKK